ncbi:hypothetical protein Aduo_014075 [Ancylostoma duodenale]
MPVKFRVTCCRGRTTTFLAPDPELEGHVNRIADIRWQLPLPDGDAENSDEASDMGNIEGLIEHCSNLVEAKYLMQHLFNACLEHAVAAAKADSLNKESEARIQQLEQQSYINEQLLSTVIEDKTLSK